jgi:SLBB domain
VIFAVPSSNFCTLIIAVFRFTIYDCEIYDAALAWAAISSCAQREVVGTPPLWPHVAIATYRNGVTWPFCRRIESREHETLVTLVSRNQSVSLSFSSLTEQASENIKLAAGDVLFVNRRPRTYSVLGAASGNAEIPFTANNITLAQAIARSGGLSDSKADASGVFIFRYETPSQISTLLRDLVITMAQWKSCRYLSDEFANRRACFFAQAFPVMEMT